MTNALDIKNSDPLDVFTQWLDAAKQGEPHNPDAMALATADVRGRSSVRMLLLKQFDERGFVFFTNSQSLKGEHLEQNPFASMCFYWKSIDKQVRIEGPVVKISDEESDAYFASRDRGSQLGAWASDQSQIYETRAQLDERVHEIGLQYEGKDVPRPPHWYGYRLIAERIEFWDQRPSRLHDRWSFEKTQSGWLCNRLYP